MDPVSSNISTNNSVQIEPKEQVEITKLFSRLKTCFENMNKWRAQFETVSTFSCVKKEEGNFDDFVESMLKEADPAEQEYHYNRQLAMSTLFQVVEHYFPKESYKETLKNNVTFRQSLLASAMHIVPEKYHEKHLNPIKKAIESTNICFSETYLTGAETLASYDPEKISGNLLENLIIGKKLLISFSTIQTFVEGDQHINNEELFKRSLQVFTESYLQLDAIESKAWLHKWEATVVEITKDEENQLVESLFQLTNEKTAADH